MNSIRQEQDMHGAQYASLQSVGQTLKLTRLMLVTFVLSGFSLSVSAQTTQVSQGTDLRSVYEHARGYDAEFLAARYVLESALQGVPQARSAFLPQISLDGEIGRSRLIDTGSRSVEESALTLSLRQSIFNRASSKRIDQAKTGVKQAEAQYAAVGQTLILRVATAYFDVLRAQANVEFSQSELQAISRQREQAERRFDVGLVPITDVRSAQAQYDLAVAQEIAASNQLSTAREALLRVSGIDAELLTPLASDLPLTPPEPADIDAWVRLAKQQNLELVIAQLANQSSATQVAIERASRYPTLALLGTARGTKQYGPDDSDAGQIQLQLSVPIYTGGRVRAEVAQAKADARAAQQQTIAQERTTTQQTRDAYRGVQASISRVRALRQALVSTEKSAEATEAGFRAGTRTSVEVLQALRDTYAAQSDYAGARYDYIINTLNLKAASGTLVEDDIYGINRFLAVPER